MKVTSPDPDQSLQVVDLLLGSLVLFLQYLNTSVLQELSLMTCRFNDESKVLFKSVLARDLLIELKAKFFR